MTRPDAISEFQPLLLDLEETLDEDHTLGALAARFGQSPFHFHRRFSEAVGETVGRHVARMRLERAAYLLAVTGQSVLDIALAMGFRSHEAFSRAFRRTFGYSPRDYRKAACEAQRARLERNAGFRGQGCVLSAVWFGDLPAMTLLARRRIGDYATLAAPFTAGDTIWTDMVRRAEDAGARYTPLPMVISLDNPQLTPKPQQRLDACLPIESGEVAGVDLRSLALAGGRYAGITHHGPFATIDQAYRNLADGIRRSDRYRFAEGPPLEIMREIHAGGDPAANRTEVYFPVEKAD